MQLVRPEKTMISMLSKLRGKWPHSAGSENMAWRERSRPLPRHGQHRGPGRQRGVFCGFRGARGGAERILQGGVGRGREVGIEPSPIGAANFSREEGYVPISLPPPLFNKLYNHFYDTGTTRYSGRHSTPGKRRQYCSASSQCAVARLPLRRPVSATWATQEHTAAPYFISENEGRTIHTLVERRKHYNLTDTFTTSQSIKGSIDLLQANAFTKETIDS